jgi:DNA-binding PadR family transcriptional regulator
MYALTDSGREVLRNGLRMIRERKPVLEALLRFYDAEFKGEKGDG